MTVFIKVSTNWLVTLVSMFFESSYEMATCLANIAGNFGHIFKLFSILLFRDGRQVLISRRVITGCNGAPMGFNLIINRPLGIPLYSMKTVRFTT